MAHHPDEMTSLLAAAAFIPPARSTDWLILGLGSGGRAKFMYHATPWRMDFVEIDARGLEVAQQYFGFPTLPRKGSSNAQCIDDDRVCVTIQDAFDHVEMLAARGRQYGLVYVDIGADVFNWAPEKQTRFMAAIGNISSVVVYNAWADFLLKPALEVMHMIFDTPVCLPLPYADDRMCFALGLGHHALSKDAALAHAAAQDAKMSWAPFALATYMQNTPLRTFSAGAGDELLVPVQP
jgi:hypothetical protein